MNLSKTIIVMNGKGGVGKDTLCNSILPYYSTMNISAIEPIKELAMCGGWNGKKDDKSRKLLADLKQLFVAYNNLPTKYLKEHTDEFLNSSNEILFVHIREADQIEEYKKSITPNKCYTILVKRDAVDTTHTYGNKADDNVNDYEYDFTFENNMPIEESTALFRQLIDIITNLD